MPLLASEECLKIYALGRGVFFSLKCNCLLERIANGVFIFLRLIKSGKLLQVQRKILMLYTLVQPSGIKEST